MKPLPVPWFLTACVLTFAVADSWAATPTPDVDELRRDLVDLRALVEQLQLQVRAQGEVIRALEVRGPAPPPSPPEAAPAASAMVTSEPVPQPAAAAPSPTSNYFNPSVSMIGNFLGAGGSSGPDALPSASLRESELSLQATVDPYARADFFLAYGEEGVEVEEGFATFTALPWSLLVKVGRMRPTFGKINTLHLHSLPWADEPLPIVNLLGGEEGWVGTGLSVARLIPLPGETFSEVTLQVFRGEAEGLFEAPERGDLAYNTHYRLFRDLSDSTNLDLGLSYAIGPNGLDTETKNRLAGANGTFRWKPLRAATYRSASVRGEYIRSRRESPLGDETPYGWFLSGEYQLARRWFLGARLEQAEHADDDTLEDRGQALILTFWPSEFAQLRGELRRRDAALEPVASEALLQIQFAIGAHGAHPF